MTTKKIFELGDKFARKMEQMNDNEKFSQQREKIAKFSHKFLGELKAIISEMDGDFAVLKIKNLDPKTLEAFADIRTHILYMMKQIDPEHPYDGTIELAKWADSKNTKLILNNLDFIITHFLEQQKEEFTSTPHLRHSRSQSIKRFQNLLLAAHKYVLENPLLPDPREQATVPPPRLLNEKEEVTQPIGNEDTTIPGIPSSKKPIAV